MTVIAANVAQAYADAANIASKASTGAGGVGGPGELPKFSELVQDMLGSAVAAGKDAEAKSAASLTGDAELIDVVTALSAAETSLETVIAVRDKVISAYQEISRMPI